ncbi:hypothetical protein [Fortiea contorta]|uniref:hypothetical protein n=1 Tax=Fortiea contorta TaxID=1892405 RepID=UPI0012B5CC9E|nr:hypothetical protein [Fortiea contorta]
MGRWGGGEVGRWGGGEMGGEKELMLPIFCILPHLPLFPSPSSLAPSPSSLAPLAYS